MCSQCKEKNERRLARRKERLEGIARLNHAIRDDDEQGMDYDELSERDPDEHEIMEMVIDHHELVNNQMSDAQENGRDPGLRLRARADGAA